MTTSTWMSTHLPTVRYISAGAVTSFTETEWHMATMAEKNALSAIQYILKVMSSVNEPLLQTILDTFPSKHRKPDLMVVDTLSHAAVDAAEKLAIPVVLNNPLPIWHDLLDSPVRR
jgi:hypothetical protein